MSITGSAAVGNEATRIIDEFRTRIINSGGELENPACLETALDFFISK